MTLRDQILLADDLPSELVDLPAQWGEGKVLVKGLTAGELADYAQKTEKAPARTQIAELLIACLRDPETGKRVFEPADRDPLAAKSSQAVLELAEVCRRLSGLGGPTNLKVPGGDAGF